MPNALHASVAARQVLCIAYFFPPSGGAGVQRPLKFVKYLPKFGWQARVLSVADGCYFAHDEALLRDIPPGTEVVRPTSLEIERLGLLRRQRSAHSVAGAVRTRGLRAQLLRVLSEARRHLIPDPQLGWLPFAVAAALRMHRRRPFQAIWSTSSPATGHLVAMAVQAVTGLPWIADFRDAWSDDPMGLLAHHRVHAQLEGLVLRRTQRCVAVTQPVIDALRARALAPAEHFAHIPNGFDPADFPAEPPPPPATDPWQITFTGSIYGKITTVPFLEALARLLRAHPEARGAVRVSFIGQMDRRAQADYEATLQRLDLGWACERRGYVSHAAAIEAMHAAHTLLLPLYADPKAAQVMAGKTFEYLAAGRPILALATEGVTADLIRRARAGLVAPPEDVNAIHQALTTLWHAHRKGGIPHTPDPAVVNEFSRVRLTQQLAGLLDSCLSEGRRA